MNRDYLNNGELLQWNYDNEVKKRNKKCNKIRGSIGDLFKPNWKKNETLKFFFSDICRPLVLDYAGNVHVNGVLGYKFVLGDSMFDNGKQFSFIL